MIHMVHMVGKRMISQGLNELLREVSVTEKEQN